MPLHPTEFENLVNGLDAKIKEARTAAVEEERKRAADVKRAETEKELRRVMSQIAAIAPKLAEAYTLGLSLPDADAAMDALKHEQKTLETTLETLPRQRDTTKDAAIRADLKNLIEEIRHTDVRDIDDDEREALYDVWALRWRIHAESFGQDRVRTDPDFKGAYALIKAAFEVSPATHYIDALNGEKTGNWVRQLEQAKTALGTITLHVQRREAAYKDMDELRMMSVHPEALDGEGQKRARHLARSIGAVEPLREELADVASDLRSKLGSEFDFLWADAKREEETPTRHLSNREIAKRILSRMLSKALIGGCHGPLEKIAKGFPEHDKGRAKEAIERLVRAGVIRQKTNVGTQRVSIERVYVTPCEKFVKGGEPFGISAVDDWCQENL